MIDKTILLIFLLIIFAILGYYMKSQDEVDFKENFSDFSNYVLKENPPQIYNNFYANLYDKLFNSATKNQFEIYNIKVYTIDDKNPFDKKDLKFLDLGCGTGGHLDVLDKHKYSSVGVDQSMKMLEKARLLTPTTPLVKGDFHNKGIFKNREFTHVTIFFYTIYYSNKVEKLFNNVNYWLKPKGFFCIHLVNKKKFDPVLERASGLIPMFNPQKHSKERVTKTKLKFNKFNYLADWNFNKDHVVFEENFLFNDSSKHVQNKHTLYMRGIKYYKKIAKKTGFVLVKIIDLTPVNHDNNYIYIFQKKYGR
jgi:SAM-dependent methyltransferase